MRLFQGTPFDVPPRCDRCEQLEAVCQCEPLPPPVVPPESQTVRVAVEKRKRGRTVTVLRGLAHEPAHLGKLLSSLKIRCGGGGTVKDDVIEVQGDHVDRVRTMLAELGYKVRVS